MVLPEKHVHSRGVYDSGHSVLSDSIGADNILIHMTCPVNRQRYDAESALGTARPCRCQPHHARYVGTSVSIKSTSHTQRLAFVSACAGIYLSLSRNFSPFLRAVTLAVSVLLPFKDYQ